MLDPHRPDPGTGELVAYDDITLAGLGETEVTIERTVVASSSQRIEDGDNGTDGRGAITSVSPAPD